MMATPDAMISRDVDKKMGLIKDFRGSGAVEINSHLLCKFWHSLRIGKAIRMRMNVINSAVPIQDNIAPDLTIICKLNQLRKSKP
jgi:hypothetical protein